ncbi:membrane protein [Bradyrhizobium sp. LTSPM299]|uniref:OPT/YSL family transporter n=1 Tax=Bradyrhizobium sp. LTSPM299 TaxID=1619233 RepID=UPI0005CB2A7A|nr:OPT/YSL family transporter [Bradyrhizobium sp. LTSPM299]KJC59317.1 membrane protein [Bradyrhizobium sp. LTSPM299]
MTEGSELHPKLFEPSTLILVVVLSVFGAIIGLQLLTTLGVTPNTSMIGALVAIGLARIPLALFQRYRSIHIQNLAQSAISAATFGAANSLLLPIGIPFVLGRTDLILPMFAGVACAMLLDGFLLYRMFDSKVFPADGAWPPGVAVAEAIRAGDEGGRKAAILGLGVGLGAAGSWFGVPMSAFGIAFIGNVWALLMFGVGLLLRGYSKVLFSGEMFQSVLPGADLNAALVPHGFMIGAGLMALIQVGVVIFRRDVAADTNVARSNSVGRTLGLGFLAYLCIAVGIALVGGLASDLSLVMLIAFVIYAAFAAFVHELLVGLAAMHSGWFPAFAIALITLLVGILIGFPIPALTLLVGFSAATGPAFADMGYDLKAGFMLRTGHGAAFEADGRRQQLYAAMAAFVVAIVVVGLTWKGYFSQNMIPPVDRVYAATIKAGITGPAATSMMLWAIPGALLQLLGGQKRQLGVLFATGLLIAAPLAGWAVLLGIVLRQVWLAVRGADGRSVMEVFAGGVIAGDALFSFFNSIATNILRRP